MRVVSWLMSRDCRGRKEAVFLPRDNYELSREQAPLFVSCWVQ